MKKFILIFLSLFFVISCASVKNYYKLEQPENSLLTASIGSTVFRVNKSSNLPNVFGRADIWGGKVDKGYTELKLMNIKENGNLILQITDINRSSTETTMDRYVNKPEVRVEVEGKEKIDDEPTPNSTVFEFDPKKENFLVIGGVRITLLKQPPIA